MARLARLVLPDFPHHVIQRGVRSLPIFATATDRQTYLGLLKEFTTRHGVQVWAWCLMTNHVHLVLVPPDETGLARAIGEAHRRFTRAINFREGVRGHLFQERFHSFPIQQDHHLLTVIRYVERNPVRAGLLQHAVDHPWSSARHHALGSADPLVRESPIREMAPDWAQVLEDREEELAQVRRHVRTGRPWGSADWLARLAEDVEPSLLPRKRGWPKGRSRKVLVEQ